MKIQEIIHLQKKVVNAIINSNNNHLNYEYIRTYIPFHVLIRIKRILHKKPLRDPPSDPTHTSDRSPSHLNEDREKILVLFPI